MTKRSREMLGWRDYVRQVIGDDRQIDVATKTGIDQTTISRWLGKSNDNPRIAPASVAAFARGYHRSVLEAFVVAGFMTAEEADIKLPLTVDLSTVSSRALAAEVRRRLMAV